MRCASISRSAGQSGPLTYARNYLEKLIQVPFRIPSLGGAETRIYTTLLLIQAEIGEEHEDFVKLLKTARELLKRPWRNPALDRTAVEISISAGYRRAAGGHYAQPADQPDSGGWHQG